MINVLLLYDDIINTEYFLSIKYVKFKKKYPDSKLYELIQLMKKDNGNCYTPQIILNNYGMNVEVYSNLRGEEKKRDVVNDILSGFRNGSLIHLIVIDYYYITILKNNLSELLNKIESATEILQYPQNIRSIPIAIVSPDQFQEIHLDDIVNFHKEKGINRLTHLKWSHFLEEDTSRIELTKIQNSLKEYRSKLLSDLDIGGFIINFNSNKIEIGLSGKPISLSMNINYNAYLKNAEQYIFIDKAYSTMKKELEGFEFLLDEACLLKNTDNKVTERKIHNYLALYPHLIYRGKYDNYLLEPKLIHHDGVDSIKQKIPDFIMKSSITNEGQIMELKLPTENIIKRDSYKLTKKLLSAIKQVKEYQQIAKKNTKFTGAYGIHHYNNPCLVIGRNESFHELVNIHNHAEINNIDILSYDQICRLDKQVMNSLLMTM